MVHWDCSTYEYNSAYMLHNVIAYKSYLQYFLFCYKKSNYSSIWWRAAFTYIFISPLSFRPPSSGHPALPILCSDRFPGSSSLRCNTDPVSAPVSENAPTLPVSSEACPTFLIKTFSLMPSGKYLKRCRIHKRRPGKQWCRGGGECAGATSSIALTPVLPPSLSPSCQRPVTLKPDITSNDWSWK